MDHFAYSNSPSRERREAFFAKNDDDKLINSIENAPDQPAKLGNSQNVPDEQMDKTRREILSNSPNVLSQCPEMVTQSPAVLLSFLSGDYMSSEQEDRMKLVARKWMNNRFDERKSLATQIIQHLDRNPKDSDDHELQEIIQEALTNPQTVLNLCYAVDERLKQYKRYLAILEKKLGKPLSGNLNITTLDMKKIEDLDKQLKERPNPMSFESWLEDSPMNIDSALRERIISSESIDATFTLPEVPEGDEELDEAGRAIKRVWAKWKDKIREESRTDKWTHKDHVTGNFTRPALLQRLKKSFFDRKGFLGMRDSETYGFDKNASSDFNAQETIGKLESQSLMLRNHLDALIQQGANLLGKQADNVINRAVPPEMRDPHSDEKIYAAFGTSTAALYHEIGEQLSPIEIALRLKEDKEENALPPEDENYLTDANQTLDQLTNLAESISNAQKNEVNEGNEGWLHAILGDERKDHQSTIDVLKELADKYDVPENKPLIRKILQDGQCDEIIALAQRLRNGNLNPDDHDLVYRLIDVHVRIKTILMSLQSHSVRSQLEQELRKPRQETLSPTKSKEWDNVSKELANIEKELFPEGPDGKICEYFDHTVCTISPVRNGLKDEIEEIKKMRRKSNANVYEARDRVIMLQNCYKYAKNLHEKPSLVKVLEAEEYKKYTKTDKTVGCYIIGKDGTIYLNASRLPKKPDGTVDKTSEKYIRTLKHEQGHALLDILIRRSGVLTGLLIDIYATLGTKIDTESLEGDTFQSLLEKQGERWMVTVDKDNPFYHDYLIDELLSKHASWVDANRTGNYSPEEITLFRGIDKHLIDQTINKTRSNVQEIMEQELYSTDDGYDETSTSASSEIDTNQKIREYHRTIHMVRSFFKEHQEYNGGQVTALPIINNVTGKVSVEQDLIDMDRFVTEKIEQAQADGHISDTLTAIEQFKKKAEWWEKGLKNLRNVDLSKVTEATTHRKNIIDMIRYGDLPLLSIMDLINIGKSIGEDIARTWKRRGESAQAQAGMIITGWIPSWVPYAGRLKHEFKRRDQASEQEEVKNWRDPLKNLDSYELMARLESKQNKSKDETKALCEELSERGRLDLNSQGFWEKLNSLSHYKMPSGPCKDDDVLRDKWLLKLISDIWNDKDLFYNWKRANDGGVESGKKKFTDTTDQLANLAGGLASELQRQLKLFVEARKRGSAIPEDVNPHLYEEVLHYSIRNGKMSMEDKFYYLIQGVRYGLLSIDRLRVMAGEGGDILMIFPFIDYFYQKNNDLESVIRLGERIDEGGYKPGSKTTLFIRLEIAREKAVKERLRKAQSKVGEKIDHDDIPYFLPELGWGAIDDWYLPLGGSRQKLSQEAVKNGYVGYNMKFKTYATLLEIENKEMGNDRVSKADVHDLIQTIGAYIYSDNLLTRNGYDGKQRPQLTEYEIDNQVPVCGSSGKSVGDYRNAMSGFMNQIIPFIDNAAWERINDSVNPERKEENDIKANNFVGLSVGKNAHNKELSANIAKSIPYFLKELENAILENPAKMQEFKEKLHQYGDSFVGDGNIGDDKTINDLAKEYKKGN